jgi:cell division protein ZapA
MCKIRDGGKVRARERIAVLAALNLAFDLADQNIATPDVPTNVSTPSAGSDTAVPDSPSADSEQLLASLLERLDSALGVDGRLL